MLKLEDITIQFGGLTALKDVSFSMGTDQVVGLVGPNGAGKTTLFNAISGLVRPTRGRVGFDGIEISRKPLHARARLGLGRTFQIPQPMHELTVRENLEMGAYTQAGQDNWARNIDQIYEWFPKLKEREDQLAGTLSGGEQQMVAIGRGLASSPKLLMLDEPSMGLAPTVADFIFDRLMDIRKAAGLTILLVEQRVAEALQFADHAYVLETGSIALEGDNQTLRADDRVRQAYLGM